MKRTVFAFFALIALAVTVAAQAPNVVTVLKGFDPVELVDGREVKGSDSLPVTRSRYRYLFASETNRKLFVKSPDEFQIQMGGGCGRMGSLSGVGNPDRYHVFNRRIYIFASEQCRNGFKAAPEKHMEPSDAPPTGTAADKQRARQLLSLALKGFGGAKQVDALKTYQARIKLAYKNGDKVDEYKQTQTIAFPNRFRDEYDWGSSTTADFLSDGGTVSVDGKGAWGREEPVRAALEREFYRHPLAILKARRNPGFEAFASGKSKVGETEVELLKAGYKGATTTLAIDPQTGRTLQAAYRGRSGGFGDVVKTFSDFREVNGIVLPFRLEESFNGKPVTSPARTVESVAINGTLDEKLFRKSPPPSSEPAPQQPEKPKAESKPPQFDLDQYQFGLLKRGPKWTAEKTPETEKIQEGHMANINKMAKMGKLVAAGPMGGGGDLRGIFIFKAASLDEAKAMAAEDPAIKAGRLVMDIQPWWGPKGIGASIAEEMKKNAEPKYTMTQYFLALLGKGPKATDAATPESQQIQLDHMWNVRRMLDAKTFASAGPFGGKGDLRGIFVITAKSREEAKAIADADPAVKAGQLSVELHPWWVAKEVWP